MMSNKERIMQLMENVPDYKLAFLINILEELKDYADESIEPDEWDLEMIEQAKKNNDGETMPLEEVCKELDVRLSNVS